MTRNWCNRNQRQLLKYSSGCELKFFKHFGHIRTRFWWRMKNNRTHHYLNLRNFNVGQFVLIFGQFVLILVNSYSFPKMSTNWPKWVLILVNWPFHEYELTKMSTNWPWHEYELNQMSTNWPKFWVRIYQNEYELTWVRIDHKPLHQCWHRRRRRRDPQQSVITAILIFVGNIWIVIYCIFDF